MNARASLSPAIHIHFCIDLLFTTLHFANADRKVGKPSGDFWKAKQLLGEILCRTDIAASLSACAGIAA